jgi:uncharacterized protein (TIGR01777 family)
MSDSGPATTSKRVLVAGGSGFVGNEVTARLRQGGYEVVVLTRSKGSDDPNEEFWDGRTVGPWARRLEGAKAVINLAGAPVTLKWTEENKRLIKDSRVHSTAAIGEGIRSCKLPPEVWINASGISIYGDTGDTEVSETSPIGAGFLAEVSLAWERAQADAMAPSTRKVRFRKGIVLGKGGGAFDELSKYTGWFLGGAQGSGRHWMSWIHIRDVAEAYIWAIESDVEGPVNLVSPEPIRNADFMAKLRAAMHRPWSPPAPEFAIKLVGMIRNIQADVVLESVRVKPDVLLKFGFPYNFPTLDEALADLVPPA